MQSADGSRKSPHNTVDTNETAGNSGEGVDWARVAAIGAEVDASFRSRWAEQVLVPAGRAPDLTVMRRLALALCGTVPSLEEIRRFEAQPASGRLDTWLDDLLRDRRVADYLAERLA